MKTLKRKKFGSKFRNTLVISVIILVVVGICDVNVIGTGQNNPPDKPTITGPTAGDPFTSYEFIANTTDPDGDQLFYWWDHGMPCVVLKWRGPYDSGEPAPINLRFGCWINNKYVYQVGPHEIRVKAHDDPDGNGHNGAAGSDGNDSEWSDTHIITIHHRPLKPAKPSGPTSGETGVEYTYTTSTWDPDENELYYKWDWGDGTVSDWIGPYGPNETASASHEWSVEGEYSVKVKAKDDYNNDGDLSDGLESNWSPPLEVTIEELECAEKPSWNINQEWQYEVNTFNLDYGGISLSLDPFDLPLEVTEIDGNQYKFEYEGDDLTGDISISISWLTVSGSLDLDMNGLYTLILDNNDLGMEEVQFSFVGIIDVSVGRDIRIDPLQITVTPKNGVYSFLCFPLCEEDTWTIPATTFDISIYLRYKRIPGIWKEKWIEAPSYTIGDHDAECIGIETVNGLEAFHVLSEGIGDYWYSPIKENVVKADGSLPFIEFYMELTSSPPYKPATPSGKTNVKVGETCDYSTSTIDPNGDRFQYGWDWNGDKQVDEWIGLYKSGETCVISHTWTSEELKNGRTQIFVKAKDVHDEESVWSDPLTVTMPRNRATQTPFLNFLQSHPNMFPILQKLLIQRLGL